MTIAASFTAVTAVVATGTGASVVATLVAVLLASAFVARRTRLLASALIVAVATLVAMVDLRRVMVATVIAVAVILSAIALVAVVIVVDAIVVAIIALTTDGAEVMATMLLEVRGAMDVSWCTMDLVVMTMHVVVVVEVHV